MTFRPDSDTSMFASPWSLFCCILGSLCLPLTLPWVLIQVLYKVQLKKQKANLQGKVVLITGASSGLGEALAHSFYKIGCRVVLAARRKDELYRVKMEMLQLYSTVTTHPPMVLELDLTDLNMIPNKVSEVLEVFEHIDILVNNGGISYRGNILTTSIDTDIKVMLVNYFGSVALTKAILPSMVKRKEGHIVCISSVQGKIAIPFRSAYATSKHALQAFSDILRAEVKEYNIDVTVVSPGYIKTDLSLNAVTGSGNTYGKIDPSTASGYSPSTVADSIINAVANKRKDIIISRLLPQLAIYLRTVWPSMYFWIMKHKAKTNTA